MNLKKWSKPRLRFEASALWVGVTFVSIANGIAKGIGQAKAEQHESTKAIDAFILRRDLELASLHLRIEAIKAELESRK